MDAAMQPKLYVWFEMYDDILFNICRFLES